MEMDNSEENGFVLAYSSIDVCFYLNITAGLLKISIIKSIITIANGKFGNIFNAMRPTLYSNG